ncbi:MAG: hypothetical protein ACFCU5_09580 [Pleurocapsa sp.]
MPIPTERIESVKAGALGAGAFVLAEIIAFGFQIWTFQTFPWVGNIELILQLTLGAIAGFLFGVTYRYIIRDDRNSHLNDGAVLAFGLVRGLASIENRITIFDWSMVILVMQSLICFAFTRWLLDLAIAKKIIKPFI